ncbi:hypothetical protein W97_02501 [Coniosporium apollinis CBS 100218]|uniref:Uncharacterized protein n=1 Tax=Coniosporium apollinis (strain CBS 100218) TaxID=1168221 RepID=R7YN82_CONA1|nr:uncharacterized protein W97_02501 [Coniosporium apollinis CBS 100218]EON63274.1 hypothetical protein W97_02501 [Coniosporium apollinis CBS 100218]
MAIAKAVEDVDGPMTAELAAAVAVSANDQSACRKLQTTCLPQSLEARPLGNGANNGSSKNMAQSTGHDAERRDRLVE